jgi:hypothetical protein
MHRIHFSEISPPGDSLLKAESEENPWARTLFRLRPSCPSKTDVNKTREKVYERTTQSSPGIQRGLVLFSLPWAPWRWSTRQRATISSQNMIKSKHEFNERGNILIAGQCNNHVIRVSQAGIIVADHGLPLAGDNSTGITGCRPCAYSRGPMQLKPDFAKALNCPVFQAATGRLALSPFHATIEFGTKC